MDKNKNYELKTGPVIRGDGSVAVPGVTIYVEKGRITALVARGSNGFRFENPCRKTVFYDLSGLTVLPPLVDCHVHLALDGVDFAAARRRREHPERIARQVRAGLEDTMRHGILAVRDGGDRECIALRCRDEVAAGKLCGPVIRTPGFALRKPHTYGSFLGRGINFDNLEEMLNGLVQHGVDLVKIIVSGVVSFREYGVVGPVQCTAGELAAVVDGARARGLPVMAHASSEAAVRLAVAAGVDTVEHGYFLNRDSLYLMAERGVAWVPTVVPVAARLNCREEKGGPGRQERLVVERTVHRQLVMIGEAASLGVTLGVGTDAGATGVRHGYGYLEELALYRRAGLSPAEIIRCATVNGARILGLDWGRIEPGRPAAFIAVKGNPLEDIATLSSVKYAFLPPAPRQV